MNRNTAIVIAIVVAGALVLGTIYVVSVTDASHMEIIFYDADGDEIGRTDTRIITFGIRQDGEIADIHSLKVVVYFKVTTDIDYIGIDTRCWLEVVTNLNTITGGHVYTLAEHRLGWANTDLEGSFYRTTNEGHYLMSELLPSDMIESTGMANGWGMHFNARLTTTIGRQDGTTKTVDDDCGTTLTLVWSETLDLDSWVAFS